MFILEQGLIDQLGLETMRIWSINIGQGLYVYHKIYCPDIISQQTLGKGKHRLLNLEQVLGSSLSVLLGFIWSLSEGLVVFCKFSETL